jgi:hypothetical protein
MRAQESLLVHLFHIIESIDADLMLPLRAHEREDRGGFFSISRQAFSYIDYLGALAADGDNSTNNAVAYMEKYFSPANPAYAGKCNLLYSIWRHGTVHEYDPKVFVSHAHAFRLRWGANNTSIALNRKWHLKCLCRASQPGSYNWFINLFELVEDLRKSVMYFIADLEVDQAYLQRAKENLVKLSAQVDLDNKPKPALLGEAISVVGDAAGVIDDQGNVIREFKGADEFESFKKDEWGNQPLT